MTSPSRDGENLLPSSDEVAHQTAGQSRGDGRFFSNGSFEAQSDDQNNPPARNLTTPSSPLADANMEDVGTNAEAVVRCVCGQTKEDESPMLCCDSCDTWQHIACVGLSHEEAESVSYLCSWCDPGSYQQRMTSVAGNETEPEGDVVQSDSDPPVTTKKKRKRKKRRSTESFERESEVTVSVKRRRERPNKRTAIHSELVSDDEMESVSSQIPSIAPLQPVDIEIMPELRNLQRFTDAVGKDGDGLRLLRIVQPTKIAGKVSAIHDFMKGSVVDGRSHVIKKCWKSQKAHRWRFELQDSSKPERPSIEFCAPLVDRKLCPKEKDARPIAERVCEYLDRLPIPPAEVHSKGANANFVAVMIQTALLAEFFPNHDWSHVSDVDSFRGANAETGAKKRATGKTFVVYDDAAQSMQIHMDVNKVDLNVHVPAVENHEHFFPSLPSDADLSTKVGAGSLSKYKQALKVVRYVQSQMHGMIGTKQDLFRRKDILLESFLQVKFRTDRSDFYKANTMHGPYDQKKAYVLSSKREKNRFHVAAAKFVQNDVKGTIPTISIRMESKTRIAYVLEKLLGAYYNGCSILEAWRLACHAADLVNNNAITSSDIKREYCQCADHERPQTVHVCQSCLSNDVCSHMGRNDIDCFVCSHCLSKTARPDVISSLPGEAMRYYIRRILQKDRTVQKEDINDLEAQIWTHVQQFRTTDDKWQDVWADAERPEQESATDRPFRVSIEGIFPVAEFNDQTVYHNHPSNIALTAMYLNRLKKLWLPAILGLIKIGQDIQQLADVDQRMEKLIDEFDHFHCVCCDYKSGPKAERVKMPPRKVRRLIEKWMRPKAQEQEARAFVRIIGDTSHGFSRTPDWQRDWTPDHVEEVKVFISQMEGKFDRTVPKAPNGAPWPFIQHHMPSTWSWYRLWRLFSTRLYRMRWVCNRKWQTQDNAETLMLECVYQYLKHGGRDEFLDLPMTCFIKHPLCFSIGHRHHGFQMRTGFKTNRPINLDEDYDETLSNICFETVVSNYAKWDYPEEMYDAIRKDLLKVRTVSKYYTVPNDCPRHEFAYRERDALTNSDSTEGVDDADYESDNELLDEDV